MPHIPLLATVRLRRGALAAAAAMALAAGGCAATDVNWSPPPAGPSGAAGPVSTPSAQAKPTVQKITIVGSGDVLLHPQLWDQAEADARTTGRRGYDFAPLLAGVKEVVSSADLAICHMETPLGPAKGPFAGYPRFSVPPQIAGALADSGYDSCSTASNHTIDQGEIGVRRTLDVLDAAGIRHAGSYRSEAEHGKITIVEVHEVKIASLAYTFSFNGLRRPAGKEWLANQIDPADILAEARRARSGGAEIVVVSLHLGTEYQHAPNSQQLSLARTLLRSPDVDLILGHHAHVVQPFEKIGDKWVAYGMGNEVAHHAEPVAANREGVLARFTFTKNSAGRWLVTRAEAIPVWMDLSPDRLINIADALDDPSTAAGDRATLRAAWAQINGHLLLRGAGKDGLKVLRS